MAEESNWSFLEGLASQVIDVGGEVYKAKYTPPSNDPQQPVQQTVTTVPADTSDRGGVRLSSIPANLEPWQIGGLILAAILALVLVLK